LGIEVEGGFMVDYDGEGGGGNADVNKVNEVGTET
jgi:hypothetical protein